MKLIIEWNGRKFGIENSSLNFDNNYMCPFLTRKPLQLELIQAKIFFYEEYFILILVEEGLRAKKVFYKKYFIVLLYCSKTPMMDTETQ